MCSCVFKMTHLVLSTSGEACNTISVRHVAKSKVRLQSDTGQRVTEIQAVKRIGHCALISQGIMSHSETRHSSLRPAGHDDGERRDLSQLYWTTPIIRMYGGACERKDVCRPLNPALHYDRQWDEYSACQQPRAWKARSSGRSPAL